MPFAAAAAAAALSSPVVTELTDDERTLRGMLQFFVCSDIQRRVHQTPLPMNYRDFISLAHEVLCYGHRPAVGSVEAPVVQLPVGVTSKTVAMSPDQMLPGPVVPKALMEVPAKMPPLHTLAKSGSQTLSSTVAEQRPADLVCAADPALPSPRKRASETSDGLTRSDVLRRKAERVVDAQVSLGRLLVQREALMAQMNVVRQALKQKAAEGKRLHEQLRLLSSAEEKHRENLQSRVRLRAEAWHAACSSAVSVPERMS